MNQLQQLKAFYNRNRNWIIAGLTFLLVIQTCGRSFYSAVPASKQNHQPQQEISVSPDSSAKESLEQSYIEKLREEPAPKPTSQWMPFLLMTGIILLFYVARKRGWIHKMMPKLVIVSTKLEKKTQPKQTLLKLVINNQSKQGLTFHPPVLVFHRFGKQRKFKIKGGDGQILFPLTLMHGTGHKLIIDINRFKAQVPELKKFKKVSISVEASNGKTYTTYKKPFWGSI
ncbi:hypothetical protein DMA11_09490 [Marinilabiliaceae bacterium JC017]|nr:hypothetical protein DMA11_09490 [Marinilabiliaceae bacterium JC017]